MKNILLAAVLAISTPVYAADSAVKLFSKEGSGSGVYIGNGEILTVAHVVDDLETVSVKKENGEVVTGKILWTNKNKDLALVKIDNSDSLIASNLSCRNPIKGEYVETTGNPIREEFVTTHGYVAKVNSSYNQSIERYSFIADITVGEGNSGGGVLDKDGNVIGLLTAIQMQPIKYKESYIPVPTGLAYVISAKYACEIMGRQ